MNNHIPLSWVPRQVNNHTSLSWALRQINNHTSLSRVPQQLVLSGLLHCPSQQSSAPQALTITMRMNPTSKWTSRDQAQFYINEMAIARGNAPSLPKRWLFFPRRYDGMESPVELTATEKEIVHDLFAALPEIFVAPAPASN